MPDAGSVWVDIIPDTKGFGPKLKAELGAFARASKVEVPVGADIAKARTELRALGPEITKLNNRRATIKVDASTAQALQKLRAVERAIDRIDGRVATVVVNTVGDGPTTPSVKPAATPAPKPAAVGAARPSGGYREPFTDISPAMQLAAWTLIPPAMPAVAALAGGLGAVAAGFGAAAAGAGAFAAAAVPAITAAVGATGDLTEQQGMLHTSLVGLSSEWQKFKEETDAPVLEASAQWVDTARSGLQRLAPVAASTAGALRQLGRDADAALDSQEWRLFFDFVDRQAAPSIRVFGRSLGNVTLGLAGMLRQMEPLWNVVAPNLERLSANFAEWANDTSNFTGFVQFMIEDGPKFVDLFASLFNAAIDVGVALSPLGTVYAEGLTYLALGLSAVAEHAPYLIQLAVAVGTARVAIDLFSRVNAGLVQPIRDVQSRLRDYADSVQSAGGAAQQAGGRVGLFQRALGGVAGVMGGPWGLAISAGVTALGLFAAAKAQAKARVEEYTSAIEADSGAVAENARAVAAKALEEAGALEIAESYGLSLERVADAAMGERDALSEVNAAIDEQREAFQAAADSGDLYAKEQVDRLNLLQAAINGENAAIKDAQASYERLQATAGGLTRQKASLNGELAEGVYQADRLKAALDKLVEGNLNAAQAEINYEAAVDRATDAVAEHGATLDTNTEAGRSNKQALVDLAKAANDQREAMEDNGATAQELESIYEEQRAEFIKVAKQMGLTGDAAEELADDYLKIPERRKTRLEVSADGKYKVKDSSWYNPVRKYQTGGPVNGPGTGTSDSIPALLSHGEHVWTAKEVEMAGGHRGVFALRQAVRMGMLGEPVRRARGGPIGDDIDLFGPANVINDHREDVRVNLQRLYMKLFDGIASDVGKAVRRMVASGLPVVQAAARWLGFPYSWGGGGLTGPSRGFGPGARTVGFDCSSLVQHAWWQGARVLLPRTTYDQIKTGVAVAKGQQIPGDLVFPHLGHVAMVVDRNRLIHAPRTGVPISYRSMYANPIAIRRPKRRASGGPLGSGDWSWVGEEGPELVHVSNPAHVFSARESARLVSDAARVVAAQPAGAMTAPLVGEYHSHIHDGDTSVREAMQEFDHYLRVLRRGGVHAAP